MYQDANLSGILSYGIAVISFGLILIPTGYVVSWAFDVLKIRGRPLRQQLSISVLVGFAVWPMLGYYVKRFLPVATPEVVGLANIVVAGVLFQRSSLFTIKLSVLAKTVAAWAIVAFLIIVLLVDIRYDDSLQMTSTVYDYVKHVSVADAISRTGVPPVNPSYYDQHPLPLFYYYFWFLLCSIVDHFGGMIAGPLACVRASVFWCTAALVALLHCMIFLNIFRLPEGLRQHWARLVALSLLIFGLDLPMNALNVLFGTLYSRQKLTMPVSLEWWNEQISSWLTSLVWVPHHTGAAVISLFCFILLRAAHGDVGMRQKCSLIVITAIGFATVLGTSVWIGLVVGLIVFAWMIFCAVRGWHNEIWLPAIVGVTSLIIVSPFVWDLLGSGHLDRGPIAFQVRRFFPLQPIELHLSHFVPVIRLLFLPLNYFLELGFFALGGMIYIRWWRRNQFVLQREELFWIFVFIVPVVVCSLLKSSIKNNDLGWRGFLLPQILLVIASLPMLASLFDKDFGLAFEPKQWVRRFAAVLVVLGLLGTFYEIIGIRFGTLDGVIGAWSFGTAEDRFEAAKMADAYMWLTRNTPRTAIIQHNPLVNTDIFQLLYGHRQAVLSDTNNGTLYGINEAMYNKLAVPLGKLFSVDATEENLVDTTSSFHIDFVVATANDPMWSRSSSWVWQARPIYASSYVRIFGTPATRR
jgi:hypothetical protein